MSHHQGDRPHPRCPACGGPIVYGRSGVDVLLLETEPVTGWQYVAGSEEWSGMARWTLATVRRAHVCEAED